MLDEGNEEVLVLPKVEDSAKCDDRVGTGHYVAKEAYRNSQG